MTATTSEGRTTRGNGPGRTVWLASFPKSGNTWMRAIVTALGTNEHLFAVNHLGSGSQPHYVGGVQTATGLDARWLSFAELDVVRDTLVRNLGQPRGEVEESAPPAPVLRKSHEVYRPGEEGAEPFPLSATRAAIQIVRDPRDVACSYAPFFGVSIDQAIDAIARDRYQLSGSAARLQTAQPWGSWTTHSRSWQAADLPFPVHLVRYEDLRRDAVGVLLPIFASIGLPCTQAQLAEAVERTHFDRLRKSEAERGFRETSPSTDRFFRKGRSGAWQEELTEAQVCAIESDHAEMMTRFGYELVSDPADRAAMAQARESRRRQERRAWHELPEHLGISVSEGEVPEQLPESKQPKPWIFVKDDQALVRFGGGAAILVEGGEKVTVDLGEQNQDSDSDPSWIVQGWAVTLAQLQRGNLSLHAATVRIGDKVIAVAGRRGAGKSTTSMALRRRGHQLLCDDVTLLTFEGEEVWTTPYARNVHLLPDAAKAVGVDFEALLPLAGGREKAGFLVEDPTGEPRRIDHVVVLQPRPKANEVSTETPSGAQRLMALANHTRRDGLAPVILGDAEYFSRLATLADRVPITVLRRPSNDWTLDTVLDAIERIAGGDPSPLPAPRTDPVASRSEAVSIVDPVHVG